MKIIFLDIDGVLNSDIYMASDAYYNEVKAAGCKDHRGYEVVLKAHHTHLDPAGIQLVNQLVEKSDATVVLSSTWRIRYSIDEMNTMLRGRGATFWISDVTPAKMSYRRRQGDIREYLEDLKDLDGVEPEAFVILDDLDEFPDMKEHFVCTPEKTGITQEHVNQALKILGVTDDKE